jgi:protein-S-isoprenylcysteine O-methyltransferase Ste14
MKRDLIVEIATYIIVPSAIFIVSPIIGKLIDSLYWDHPQMLAPYPSIVILGILLTLSGFLLAVWTIYLFKTIGKGTPNPSLPPKNLISAGPYKYSRNPMALGGFIVLLGESLLYYSPSLLGISLLYALILTLYVIYVEELKLKQRFGAPYEAYMEKVPRIFPKLYK